MSKLIFLLFLSVQLLTTAQPRFETVMQRRYEAIPFKLRVENSGIYCISSFSVEEGKVYLKASDGPEVIRLSEGNTESVKPKAVSGADFSLTQTDAMPTCEYSQFKNFYNISDRVFTDNGGILRNGKGEYAEIRAESRSRLSFSIHSGDGGRFFSLSFPGNLAAADIIGTDMRGNIYLLAEKYIREIPLEISREILVVNASGSVSASIDVPMIKYLSVAREFQLDADGSIYHMISDAEGITIVKISGLAECGGEHLQYPDEFCRRYIHFNNYVSSKEPKTDAPLSVDAAASRVTALRLGEQYVLYKYGCKANNLSPVNVIGPDGDTVRTPSWLIAGVNARVPYKWGGFNSLATFADGLNTGKWAGDIHTDDVSAYAVGVDCSGFVSRCWQMSSHWSTSEMPGITTQYSTWDSLRPGDAIHRVGHVRMFIEKCPNGSLKVVESSGRDWGVSYYSYLPSDLTTYTPRYLNTMVSDYSFKRPQMTSSIIQNSSSLKLDWSCDTAGVLGYRLYKSTDGTNWPLLMSEQTLKSNSVVVDLASGAAYYRVSSVLNNGLSTESNWSNVLGAGSYSSQNRVLIVDGFDREIGDWRGSGHTFVMRYERALERKGLNFESIRHKQLSQINFDNYKAVIWISGDQSTADETFSSSEQLLIKSYLENGGCLFVSGSEIGWDLSAKGSASDKLFYNNYLKAGYIADDAGNEYVTGMPSSSFAGCSFKYAQVYAVDFPDEIAPFGGAATAFNYGNGKVAGVQYSGPFGASLIGGKVIYLGFPLETTANDTSFNAVLSGAMQYFSLLTKAENQNGTSPVYELSQNYPNPFNPSTTIKFTLPERANVRLTIYNSTGQTVGQLLNGEADAGIHCVVLNAVALSSGVYFYELRSGGYRDIKKFIVIK